MTELIQTKLKKQSTFGKLECGDCFFNKDRTFCIKVSEESCIAQGDDRTYWEEVSYEEKELVFPVDVEIHIVN